MKMIGGQVYIKILSTDDISHSYVQWLQDEEIFQYLETRWKSYTLEELKIYVRSKNMSDNDFLFGIFMNESGEHIGNLLIRDVNYIHRFGELGLIIGNKNMWGKGYGTQAIKLAIKYASEELNLKKIFASMYSNNIASYKAFIKAGFREVGRYIEHYFFKGNYIDKILLENLFKKE